MITTITLGNLVINLSIRRATYQNKAIPLTKLEYDLLLYLIQNQDKVCTYDDLLENVWKYENGRAVQFSKTLQLNPSVVA